MRLHESDSVLAARAEARDRRVASSLASGAKYHCAEQAALSHIRWSFNARSLETNLLHEKGKCVRARSDFSLSLALCFSRYLLAD